MYNGNASADFNEVPERRGGGSDRTKSLSVSFKVCLESQPKRVEFLFERNVAERLERWTYNPEVPSSNSTLTMDWICSQ